MDKDMKEEIRRLLTDCMIELNDAYHGIGTLPAGHPASLLRGRINQMALKLSSDGR